MSLFMLPPTKSDAFTQVSVVEKSNPAAQINPNSPKLNSPSSTNEKAHPSCRSSGISINKKRSPLNFTNLPKIHFINSKFIPLSWLKTS